MSAPIPPSAEEVALSLALAIVSSSPAPLLLLDGSLAVVAASASFCDAFGVDAGKAPGQSLSALGDGEWSQPVIGELLAAALSGAVDLEAQEIDLIRQGGPSRRVVLSAQRLTYLDLNHTRLLLAATDVTEARATEALKDEALRRHVVLLQEVRHRVANSLQIIASVLLQNARRTPSDETRSHLTDAHQRVMSIAALERQLAGSGDQDVDLKAYFTSLCESIAGSMIEHPPRIALIVAGSAGEVSAATSVSLGLIATELVINAIKHAFPFPRTGEIEVGWTIEEANWTLSVTDNGVGMHREPAGRTGLGASIVDALAKQLGAAVEVSSAQPGTRVRIIHPAIRLVDVPKQAPEAVAVIQSASKMETRA